MQNALKAISIALALLDAGTRAYTQAAALFTKARSEGRDVTDAELDALQQQSTDALNSFRSQIGA